MAIAMPLGIKLTVDFAFKKIFGSPEYSDALIGLLNSILNLRRPIVEVEILNPFSYQEFQSDKLIVLDVRCIDQDRNWINVEMQVSAIAELVQRLVYYACSLYKEQLTAGKDYTWLRSAVSICLINHQIFPDTQQSHHCFELVDKRSGKVIERAIQIHTIELPKYNVSEEAIGSASELEKWVFLVLRAHEFEAIRLRELLPSAEFQRAITGLETISHKTTDRIMYDQREKAQRDYDWAISSAKKQGIEEGIEQGIEQGIERGIEQGIEQGIERGEIQGKIHLLQSLLGEAESPPIDLNGLQLSDLESLFLNLQSRLRSRDA